MESLANYNGGSSVANDNISMAKLQKKQSVANLFEKSNQF